MNPIYSLLPKQSAAVALGAAHIADGAMFARQVAAPGSTLDRIDAALRAANAFDHAIAQSKAIPVRWVWRGAAQAYRGYDLANQVVKLALATRVLPDVSDRMAAIQLGESARELRKGAADWSGSGRSRYESYRAGGWVDAASRDAMEGALYVRDAELIKEAGPAFGAIRGQMSKRTAVDQGAVDRLAARLEAARPDMTVVAAASDEVSPELQQALSALAAFGREIRGAQA